MRDAPGAWSEGGVGPGRATLAISFALVYLVAMATTLVPARRAARIYSAEALRYE